MTYKELKENTYRTIKIEVDGKREYKIIFLNKGIEEVGKMYNKVVDWMGEEDILVTTLRDYFPEIFYTYQVVKRDDTLYIQGVGL